MIDLHFVATPNGQKISIALEEVGLPYRIISYDIFEGDQHTPEFGRINPNHKLPAIVDHDPPFGGGPHAVFESGAILQYLAEKTGQLLPKDPRQRSVAIQWLTWQVAGLGPMGGTGGALRPLRAREDPLRHRALHKGARPADAGAGAPAR
ncbi:glutathione S-transferase N-terminal domain-containing protein [Phenylobacterium sp. J426]|uniref:glutathione S-transferase N-terminal domain-containing protein n=1 Tax=Phenylobacterium sp. J426 TaxID=2898439 RepID=UPI00215161A5|nr:glutathione S-transferase N-terminal domain-containing protein [Phenylobacterium sp. J426]MCR5875413.1 glutathione S-transferase N-terminal domain-containing protein [Phenylobacterium sp. J426]